MNRYDVIVNWLNEEHNEVYNQWAQIESNIEEEEASIKAEEERLDFEREKPHLIEMGEWFKENQDFLNTLGIDGDKLDAINLSFHLILDAINDKNYQLIDTYMTAIKSIASVCTSKLQIVGYLKDGRRVITPFNHCWRHTHGDDIKFNSSEEYDWREEE